MSAHFHRWHNQHLEAVCTLYVAFTNGRLLASESIYELVFKMLRPVFCTGRRLLHVVPANDSSPGTSLGSIQFTSSVGGWYTED